MQPFTDYDCNTNDFQDGLSFALKTYILQLFGSILTNCGIYFEYIIVNNILLEFYVLYTPLTTACLKSNHVQGW